MESQHPVKTTIISVITQVETAFFRMRDDLVRKKFRSIFLLVLAIVLFSTVEFAVAANWLIFAAFLLYGWENRVIAGAALLFLLSCPILLAMHRDALAETMAVQAYFFLVMTVVMQMVELKREQENRPFSFESMERIRAGMRKKVHGVLAAAKKGVQVFGSVSKKPEMKVYAQKARTMVLEVKQWRVPNLFAIVKDEVRGLRFVAPKVKFDPKVGIFAGLSVIILGAMLLPGYLLTLDMVFVPYMPVGVNPDAFSAFVPISYLLHWASVLVPAWLVQKGMLLGLFTAIGYGAFALLPVGPNKVARWFAALVYLANPFVYSRLLAGQWVVLIGYALLPLVLRRALLFWKKKDSTSGVQLGAALAIMGVFSIHFLVMSLYLIGIWFGAALLRELARHKTASIAKTLRASLIGAALFFVASAYWMVPALLRKTPIEQRFGIEHWEAFAGGEYRQIGPMLNLVSLNGFWGERTTWAQAFLHPQDRSSFWIAFAVLFLLVIIGAVAGLRAPKHREKTTVVLVIGLCALIFSAGVGDTPVRGLNAWLFAHAPFWTGFRDSQKFSGWLALSYAVLGGMGLAFALDFLERRRFAFVHLLVPMCFAVPFFLGFFMWGGFHGQLKPVQFPAAWYEAKDMLDADPSPKRVLFLPWHGYLSFAFNDNLVMANPARRFFGEKAIVSRSVEVGDIYDQEQDSTYRELDRMIRENGDPDAVIDFLRKRDIKYVVYFQDLVATDTLRYDWLVSKKAEMVLRSPDLVVYKLKNGQ